MKFKCIHCGERKLIEKFHDGELRCSHAVCEKCGAKLVLWYDENEQSVALIEDDEGEKAMNDEITKALDMLDSEEAMTEYQKSEAKRRRLFFKAMGIEDDGRLCPVMTEEEFRAFDKPCKELKYNELKGKETVEVFFKFEPYHDVSFVYCFNDDTVYESRFYIGD